MNKSEVMEKLGIANRTALDRLEKRLVSSGLLSRDYGVSPKNGKRERQYSQADLAVLSGAIANGNNAERSQGEPLSPHSQLERRNGHGQLAIQPIVQMILETVRPALESIGAPDKILSIRDLPISRARAISAQKNGNLRMFLNHPYLGRGWRLLESDWRKFLRGIQ